MIPVLFEIGPLKVYSFGLMVLLAFAGGGALVMRELKRRGLKPDHLEGYPMVALLGGVAGAKLYWVFTSWDAFIADPIGSLAAGFTTCGRITRTVSAAVKGSAPTIPVTVTGTC